MNIICDLALMDAPEPASACWLVVLLRQLLPGILLRQHCTQITEICLCLLWRKFLNRDALSLGKPSLKTHHEREVLANAAVGARLGDGRLQICLGGTGIARQDIGHAKVREHTWIVRVDIYRLSVCFAGHVLPCTNLAHGSFGILHPTLLTLVTL